MANQMRKKPDPFDVALGGRVRIARQAQRDPKISLEWLARDIGVTAQQMQKYEKGETPLTVARLDAIARALNVPIIGLLRPPIPPGVDLIFFDGES
jgi:transcriptional regulator with XRE-family HTH domain